MQQTEEGVPETTKKRRVRFAASSAAAVAAVLRQRQEKRIETQEEPPPRLPVPLVVIQDYLLSKRSSPAASSSSVLVEVEVRQGYVYEGVLESIDDFYNVTLSRATVRRRRICDVEREAVRRKYKSISGLVELPPEMVERHDGPTQRQFIGETVLRSNNIYMMCFVSAAELDAEDKNNGEKSRTKGGRRKSSSLVSAFKSMGVAVKKELERRRQLDRQERRRRLNEVIQPVKRK